DSSVTGVQTCALPISAAGFVEERSKMRTLDFVSLRLFAVVIEHGNIAQASRVNGIAASAISKRISDLEDQIGVALIHRLRDGIRSEERRVGEEWSWGG